MRWHVATLRSGVRHGLVVWCWWVCVLGAGAGSRLWRVSAVFSDRSVPDGTRAPTRRC